MTSTLEIPRRNETSIQTDVQFEIKMKNFFMQKNVT